MINKEKAKNSTSKSMKPKLHQIKKYGYIQAAQKCILNKLVADWIECISCRDWGQRVDKLCSFWSLQM